jgi:hypothetical protein
MKGKSHKHKNLIQPHVSWIRPRIAMKFLKQQLVEFLLNMTQNSFLKINFGINSWLTDEVLQNNVFDNNEITYENFSLESMLHSNFVDFTKILNFTFKFFDIFTGFIIQNYSIVDNEVTLVSKLHKQTFVFSKI